MKSESLAIAVLVGILLLLSAFLVSSLVRVNNDSQALRKEVKEKMVLQEEMEKLKKDNTFLKEENKDLKEKITHLEHENLQLNGEIKKLNKLKETLEENLKNSLINN